MSSEVDARAKLTQLAFGHLATHAVAAATRLGVLDAFDGGQLTFEELARRCATDPEATLRLSRALAGLGLVEETDAGVFTLTDVGALLRSDRPDSVRELALMFADPTMVRAWERLDDSVRTGDVAFDAVFGTDFFSYLGTQPELSTQFNKAMSQGTRAVAAALPGAYDFARFETLTDIGGGDGTLLAAVLREHPTVRGVLFDTADGLAESGPVLEPFGERCSTRTGDFFAAVPEGADGYLIKSVLHDWDDQKCVTILRNCRAVLPDDGRVLILEPVLPETVTGEASPITYLSDLNMMVNVGGKERTRSGFQKLLAEAGFTLVDATPLPAPAASFWLLEAVPA
ncbi:methyltransferase family protein [Herbihabitans rhizosphaerae]|uniref:Methyltransferase family protein n=1 Tax=Herbihabitans rhizosphaerae TaxID=1872711 RepID=A0A4Q7KW90_9PSEU|nr:methyltransferase [Herbihabitans rhizosphaerae]RZS40846.1 methyltransferase family protein [Herbihabitans rhizosphaerae]